MLEDKSNHRFPPTVDTMSDKNEWINRKCSLQYWPSNHVIEDAKNLSSDNNPHMSLFPEELIYDK